MGVSPAIETLYHPAHQNSCAAWTIAHAYFIIMGGYYFYGEDGPLHPLSPDNAVELVGRGHLVPLTPEELANQSKGDALSKGVAILQTLWFVMQCIARGIEHLPVTNLEVMTLAYTVMTVAMYVVWWDKPLNINCAVRVPEEEINGKEEDKYGSSLEQIVIYVIGWQDRYVDLHKCTQVRRLGPAIVMVPSPSLPTSPCRHRCAVGSGGVWRCPLYCLVLCFPIAPRAAAVARICHRHHCRPSSSRCRRRGGRSDHCSSPRSI